MTKEQFEREKEYLVSLYIIKRLLKNEIITEDEFKKIKKILLEKHSPIISSLAEPFRLDINSKQVLHS